MRVLVTGGLGFIGNAVVAELIDAGHQVDVLTRGRNAHSHRSDVRLIECDIRDRAGLVAALRSGYNGIVHLAAVTNGRESLTEPLTYWDVNAGGTLNLLHAIQQQHTSTPPRFVLASTNIVYGSEYDGALSEDRPPQPESPYARSKVAAEQLVQDATSINAVRGLSLRVFNAAGAAGGVADIDPGRLIPNVLRVARGELPELSINGDGSVVRDYTHVLDVARAFRLAIETTDDKYSVLNVGTGTGASIREIVAAAELVTGRRVAIKHLPPRPEPPVSISNSTLIRQTLGWRPFQSDVASILKSAWTAT